MSRTVQTRVVESQTSESSEREVDGGGLGGAGGGGGGVVGLAAVAVNESTVVRVTPFSVALSVALLSTAIAPAEAMKLAFVSPGSTLIGDGAVSMPALLATLTLTEFAGVLERYIVQFALSPVRRVVGVQLRFVNAGWATNETEVDRELPAKVAAIRAF